MLQSSNTFLDYENLIELFEFVVSPADKIINGAVYTPKYIRDYIISQTINSLNSPLNKVLCGDFACGCGAFLFSLARVIQNVTGGSYASIFPRLYGLDITSYSIQRTKILLSLLAVQSGEDLVRFDFNLYCGNALNFNFNDLLPDINKNKGFDLIVGNPPYVCSRNMDSESMALLHNWSVTKSGHPDLYIPFFQIGYENLRENGILGYITVNTFIKSVNGRALRQYFSDHKIRLIILNFGGEQLFRDRNTYTCLCFIENKRGPVSYIKTNSAFLAEVEVSNLFEYSYDTLDNYDGWNLVNSVTESDFLQKVECIGVKFKNRFTTRNGIATLKNDIYKFRPIHECNSYYYLKTGLGKEYRIEKGICRGILNANKVKSEKDLINNQEKIIFPYTQLNAQTIIICEQELIDQFPFAYQYLKDHQQELSTRDKGSKVYEEWYAYGRRQSLDIHAYKLFFPHICERPTFVLCQEQDLLFYNGIAVISNNIDELLVLKEILESNIFFQYIKATAKDYSSGYISMSRNYMKNFGIVDLTERERVFLLRCNNKNDIEQFLLEKYDLNVNNKENSTDLEIQSEPLINLEPIT